MRTKLALICVLFFAISCSNKNPKPSSLIGNWEWVKSVGGIAGITILPTDTTAFTLEIYNNSNFRLNFINSKIINGSYVIVKEKSIIDQKQRDMIVFDNAFMKCSYTLNGDSLFLNQEVFDGYGYAFIRK